MGDPSDYGYPEDAVVEWEDPKAELVKVDTPKVLRILHAPGHAPDVSLASVLDAERTGADSIGYSEAYRIAGSTLAGSRDYQVVRGMSRTNTRAVRSPRGDAGDNPIAVRDDHHIADRRAYRVTRPGFPRKFAPERWVTVAVFEWRDAGEWVTHINIHPSPRFVGLSKWHRVMAAGLREVRKAKAQGRLVVLTGDLQTGAARRMLERAGLKVWQVGVDYIAYDQRFTRHIDGDSRTFKPAGMDHPWMLAELSLVR